MTSVSSQLKLLRERAIPKLSMRAIASQLGMNLSAYTHYEDERTFKKPYLPMELVRSLVPVLTARGIDRVEILALGGVEPGESVPEIPEPQLQLVTMQVALPSEDALTRMFEGLLLPLDQTLSTAELARMLAQRLPTAFAQLRDLLPDTTARAVPGRGAGPQSRATNHRESPR